jgi:hypothetical protein
MKRIQFFELEDLPWFPKVLRDAGTGFLNASHKLLKLDRLFVPKIVEVLKKSNSKMIVDLGSGAGGPTPELAVEIRKLEEFSDLAVTLTDFYPNRDAIDRFKNKETFRFLNYYSEPVNAAAVPKHLQGLRTMFVSFHHMPGNIALEILRNAQESREPIAIFEAFGRNIPSALAMLPSFLIPFILMPFVRPFRIANIVFTYLVPLVPILIFFDGWVSFLRIYSPQELKSLVDDLPKDSAYRWEIGEIGSQRAPFLIGIPIKTKS